MNTRIPKPSFRTTQTTQYCCRYHVVFCPQYRRSVLREPIAKRLKELIEELQEPNNFILLDADIQPNCVHLIVDVDPTIGVNKVVKRIKARSSNVLRKEFPELVTRIPSLWTRAKLIVSVGYVPLNAMEDYINSQPREVKKKRKTSSQT